MKKRNVVIIALLLVLATVMPFVFGACAEATLKLAKPTLEYDEEKGIVSWASVGMTDGYDVTLYRDVNGEKEEEILSVHMLSESYALPYHGTFWVGVVAVSSNQKMFANSDEALISVVKKSTEEDVTVPDNNGEEDEEEQRPEDPENPGDGLPSNAPDLGLPAGAVQKFNYMSAASVGGISVALTENTGKVVALYSNGAQLKNGWSYDAENNAIDLEYDMFGDVSTGIDTKFSAVDEKGAYFEFYVTVCSVTKTPSAINLPSYGAYVFCKNSASASEGVYVAYASVASTLAVSVDGVKITNSTSYDATSEGVQFKESYLKNLGYGLHEVELFTTAGIIDFYLFVYSSSIMCYDLSYEYDNSYPDVVINWKVDYPIDRYEVVVNDVPYSSDNYSERFDGNSFNLSGLIGATCSVKILSYVQGADKPASSSTLSYTDYYSEISEYLDASYGFTYLGKTYNRYINSKEEMEILAYYMILYNYELDTASFNTSDGSKIMTYMDVCVDPALGIADANNMMTYFYNACTKYKESIKYSYAVQKLTGNTYRIGLSMTSQNEALYDSETVYEEGNPEAFHLEVSSRPGDFEDFAINERAGVKVETSDQLFFAIEAGYKPLPVAGSVAEKLYEEAKDVCRKYVDDDMTDYEKVHAIYDWLGANVVYDYQIVSEMGNIQPSDSRYNRFYSYDSFYLEGVLENGVAVCNGIAKTFVVLCGIEGISAYKVNGKTKSGAHAWNKVCVNEKWYIVDSTWSNKSPSGNKEYFTHDYLFLTTSESSSDRTEQTEDTLKYYCGDTLISSNFRYVE